MHHAPRRARAVPVSTGTACISTVQLRGFKVLDARFPAGLRIPTHTHETACVTVVMEGEFRERLMGRDRLCARGSVLAKPPRETHDDAFGRSGSRQLIIEVEPGTLAATFAHGQPFDTVVHGRAAEADVLARSLVRELVIADAVSPLALEGLTLELLALVWRLHSEPARRRPPGWLLRAREHVTDQFTSSVTLTRIAADAGVHPTHLAREFRSHFGESVGHYVRRLRVEWSKTQLLTSTDTLASVAVRAGFSDQAHFTRWFKRQTGVTPHRYRSTWRRADFDRLRAGAVDGRIVMEI